MGDDDNDVGEWEPGVLDWCCSVILNVRHPCLVTTFLNYSACWRSKKVLVNTSDAAPVVSGQNRVVIVSSVIAKIFNLASVGWSQFDLYEWCSRFNQYSLLLFVASYLLFVFCSVQFEFIQCSIRFYCSVVILFGKYSVLILEMCSRYFDPVNNNHLQSINIIHQTAPSLS